MSIKAGCNYPSEQKDMRFTVGTVSQNLSENQYDTVTKKTGQNETTDEQQPHCNHRRFAAVRRVNAQFIWFLLLFFLFLKPDLFFFVNDFFRQ